MWCVPYALFCINVAYIVESVFFCKTISLDKFKGDVWLTKLIIASLKDPEGSIGHRVRPYVSYFSCASSWERAMDTSLRNCFCGEF